MENMESPFLEKRPKFFCINDNMNRTRKSFPRVFNILSDFFEMYFPHPSSFEKREEHRTSSAPTSTTTKSYIWQYPPQNNNTNVTFGAVARALQYGYTIEEFEKERDKWIQEYIVEVFGGGGNNVDVETARREKNIIDVVDESLSSSSLDSIKMIFAIGGFLILLVLITMIFIKIVVVV